jgi:acyl carrier protein
MTGTRAAVTASRGRRRDSEILALWRTILRRGEIAPKASFFALGGRSIQVVQMLAQVSKTYDVTLDYKRFFEEPTLAMLSCLLDEKLGP